MWMSADKRRALAKETSRLPYLASESKGEAELATRLRSEILDFVFDRFIRPDGSGFDLSAPSRLNRATQLWKALLTEKRASYFIELNDSRYADWIETGEAVALPCTTEEIESRNSALPELRGEESVIRLGRQIRATLLKCSDMLDQQLRDEGDGTQKRMTMKQVRDILARVTDPEWFIRRQPKAFAKYQNLLVSWLKQKTPRPP